MLDLDAIRSQLTRERNELLNRLQAPLEMARGDDADLATMAQNKEHALWLAQDARQRLEAIEKALQRIERGNYGLCVNCGKPIPEERLLAVPLTLYDIECQTKLERKPRR